jgi:dienelactone hydrolase
MIVFSGTEDPLIPPALLRSFANDYAAAGGKIELCLFQGEGHGFFNYRGDLADPPDGNWEFSFATTMQLMTSFLDRHIIV